MSEFVHAPVLVPGVLALLDPKPDNIVVDATLGLGGHAEAILSRLGEHGKLIGIDQDESALSRAHNRLKSFGNKFITLRGNFRNIGDLVGGTGHKSVDRILLDLGVSSLQLDDGTRGFSFKFDAPLDMRMDQLSAITAGDVVASYSEEDLVRIFEDFGEEPRAKLIAKRIVETRTKQSISTTNDLVKVVGGRIGRIHPATRIFQALRMEVNDELGAIREGLPQAVDLLVSGGRLAVITFHSIEDRLVKQLFKQLEEAGKIRLVNKKVLQATWEEKKDNPRSRSAKLRVIEKI